MATRSGAFPYGEPLAMTIKPGLNNHSLRGLLTEAFVCSSKALHRDPNDLWCHLILARHDTAINSAVNCRCRQRVRRAYFHNLKLRLAMFVNVSFRLGFLAVS
jgi:hypothetical protein